MRNEYYFSIEVKKEQITYAQKLVDYSLKHHPVSNIWDENKKKDTPRLRMTGTTGEVVFADVYRLPRPVRSYGALDGQDYGKDFVLTIGGKSVNFDLKTMHRKSNRFYRKYVLNIPARNIRRQDSLTDHYFCISLHDEGSKVIASFLGFFDKKEVLSGAIGILYPKGSKRVRADQTSFVFQEDTYEVFFEDLYSPFLSPRIEKMDGFRKLFLK